MKEKFGLFVCMLALLVAPVSGRAEEKQSSDSHIGTYEALSATVSRRGYDLWQTVISDHKNFYSLNNAAMFAAGLGVSAITANTSADREIREWYKDSVKSDTTDDIATVAKGFGEGLYTIPAYLGIAVLGEVTNGAVDSIAGEWARRCLRATLVGVPPMLVFQEVVGSSRPDEGSSHWDVFHDDNGVSGHGFIGAIPFLSAAMMARHPLLKWPLYAASTLPALSRINDDAHYFSQAFLGWWIAFLAARSVDNTEVQKGKIVITPAMGPDLIGIVASMKF